MFLNGRYRNGLFDKVGCRHSALTDGAGHIVQWTRTANRRMVVRFDGVAQIEATDRAFLDPFDGVSLITRGGEYRLATLGIDGAE